MFASLGTRRLTNRTRTFTGIAACALVVGLGTPAPAHAEGFFETLFGGLKRAVRGAGQVPKAIIAPIEPLGDAMRGQPQMPQQQTEAGRSGPAYCVRTCDGYYFPVRSAAGVSPKQMCGSLCPACETKVFYGSGSIETTVAADGTRYADMPKAYAYRQTISDACTCNGKSPLGLARMAVANDPTLRSGDVVVTRRDAMVFNGTRGEERRFTPVKDYPGFSQRMRNSLERIDVAASPAASHEQSPAPTGRVNATDDALKARAEAPSAATATKPEAPAAPASSSQSSLDFHQRWAADSTEIASSNARFNFVNTSPPAR
jgi:hypothetical protein